MPEAVPAPDNFRYRPAPRLPTVAPGLIPAGWLGLIALLNVFYAISVIAGSEIFITTASWLVGDARPWGWLMLAVGLVQLAAVPGVVLRRWWALWICLLSILGHMVAAAMFTADSTWLGIALLLFDLMVLGALLVTASD